MNWEGTLEFMRIANFVLRDSPCRYRRLLSLLYNGRMRPHEVAEGVQQMLQDDRPEIIFFFNAFIPEGHKIPLSSPLVDGAKDLILKVKERSGGGGDVDDEAGGLYASFIDILGMHSRGLKQRDEARQEILALFQHHQDLQQDFECFFSSAGEGGGTINTGRVQQAWAAAASLAGGASEGGSTAAATYDHGQQPAAGGGEGGSNTDHGVHSSRPPA